jgi:hypothetical protein
VLPWARSDGNGGGWWVNRMPSRASASTRIATPEGLWIATSHVHGSVVWTPCRRR